MKPDQKYTLLKRDGTVTRLKRDDSERVTICDLHKVLEKVDRAYDMGKRMGLKLKEYHDTYKIPGGWRTSI